MPTTTEADAAGLSLATDHTQPDRADNTLVKRWLRKQAPRWMMPVMAAAALFESLLIVVKFAVLAILIGTALTDEPGPLSGESDPVLLLLLLL
ncbi:MAG: hypothetical protein AAF446_07745, partial [Pseudomonadota bacterium]